MAEDYYSFEDVMRELSVDEDELKRMVSEGELRAFRSENKMKFKADDVEGLKKGRVSEPTVILPTTPTPPAGVPAVDETALELDLESELGDLRSADAPSRHDAPTTIGSEEPLAFEETGMDVGAPTKAPDETFAEEEEISITPDTEPLKFSDIGAGSDEMTVEAPIASGDVLEGVAAGPARRPRAGARRGAPTQVPAYVEEQIEKRRAHWVWSLIMSVTMIGAVAYVLLVYDVLRVSTGKIESPSKLTEGIVTWTLKHFWDDPEYLKFHLEEMPKDPNAADPENADPIVPPFHKYHRDYDYISFREPRKAIPYEELEKIRELMRIEEEGMPEGGGEETGG